MYHLAKSLYRYATFKEEYSVLLLGLDNAGKTTLLTQIKNLYLPSDSSSSSPSPSSSSRPPQPVTAKIAPTVGQNVATITLPDMYLKIWDVGGQLSMRSLWQSYYSSCHAIIFVVDSTDVGQDADIEALRKTSRRKPDANGGSSHEGNDDEDEDGGEGDEEEEDTSQRIKPIDPNSNFGRLDECRQVLESVLRHSDTAGVPILVLANKQDREDCVEVVRIKEGFVRKVFEGAEGARVRDSRVLPVSALWGTGVREAVEWVHTRVKWNKESRPPVMR